MELSSLIRKIFFSSLAGIVSSHAGVSVNRIPEIDKENYDHEVKRLNSDKNDLVPKLILKKNKNNELTFASHRSHRSHRSHSSHYSSSSNSSSRKKTQPKKEENNNQQSYETNSIYNSNSNSSNKNAPSYDSHNNQKLRLNTDKSKFLKLGDRLLVMGLSGSDVTELINILLKKKYLVLEDGQSQVSGMYTYDETVKAAVQAFQSDNGLVSDGICDFQTVYKLKEN